MVISFEITENEAIQALQTKILANKQQTEEERNTWLADVNTLDDYLFKSISEYIDKRNSGKPFYTIETNVWEYQVCTNDGEEIHM